MFDQQRSLAPRGTAGRSDRVCRRPEPRDVRGAVLAVGRHAYVFPRSADSRTPPELVDSIIGVQIDAGGRVSLVRNPATPRRVLYLRAVTMPNGAFAVLYATTAAEGLLTPFDTATLWHATLRNGSWTPPTRVASVRTGPLDRASALLYHGNQLAFVYPFRDDRRHDEDGGAVMLRQTSSGWTADTLRTDTEPSAVVAVADPSRRLVLVVLVVADAQPPLLAQRLLFARFDSAWSETRVIAGDGRRPVTHPSVVVVRNGFVASWLEWPRGDHNQGRLHWLLLTDDQPNARSAIDSGPQTFPFELRSAGGNPLWLYHGEPFGEAVRLVTAEDQSIVRLPDMKAEFWNPSTKTIALSGSRLLVFTQRKARVDTEPMAASFTTALEVRCPRSAQR